MSTQCHYLKGANEAPLTAAKARALIGRRVTYLRKCDIDQSGRGYFFPKTGRVIGQYGRLIELDVANNFIRMDRIVELTAEAQS